MDENIKPLRSSRASILECAPDPIVARVREATDDNLLVETDSGVFAVARMTMEVARIAPERLSGSEVLILYEGGNPEFPIAVAVLHSAESGSIAPKNKTEHTPFHAVVDDEELILNAKKKIQLRCGEGSITITRDGKIVLRGTHLLSRSSGPLRIKGGHVDIN